MRIGLLLFIGMIFFSALACADLEILGENKVQSGESLFYMVKLSSDNQPIPHERVLCAHLSGVQEQQIRDQSYVELVTDERGVATVTYPPQESQTILCSYGSLVASHAFSMTETTPAIRLYPPEEVIESIPFTTLINSRLSDCSAIVYGPGGTEELPLVHMYEGYYTIEYTVNGPGIYVMNVSCGTASSSVFFSFNQTAGLPAVKVTSREKILRSSNKLTGEFIYGWEAPPTSKIQRLTHYTLNLFWHPDIPVLHNIYLSVLKLAFLVLFIQVVLYVREKRGKLVYVRKCKKWKKTI